MFAVIYSFQIKAGQESLFENSWQELTLMIRDYEGGLGSRLHRAGDLHYIAYAQWPDKKTWENSGSKLPEHAAAIRSALRGACEKIETLYELDVVNDLLVQ